MFYFADKEEPLNIHSLARSKHVHMFCRHCDTALLHAGIQKKKSEIPFLTKEEQVQCNPFITHLIITHVLDITWSCCGAYVFYIMEFYKGIIGK